MGRRRNFLFSINYLQVFIHRPPEGIVHMGLERGGAVTKGKGEKSLAGVLWHIVRHLSLFTARHGCRVHRLISRKHTLTSWRYKSLRGENWGSFFFTPNNIAQWQINCNQGIIVCVNEASDQAEQSQFDWDDYLEQLFVLWLVPAVVQTDRDAVSLFFFLF